MERLLTAIEGQLRRAWIAMIGHLRETHSVTQIAGRMQVQDPGAVLHGLEEAAASFAAAEHNAYVTAGQTAARWLRRQFAKRAACGVAKKLFNFDPGDATAVAWAEQNRLDLIREITREQRVLIRDALIGGATSGVNPRVTAAEIRDAIGLTAFQERAVRRYRAALERGHYTAALQRELSSGVSDRTIAAARAAGRELTSAPIDAAVARYRANYVAMRAETIARTEALRVAHQGTEELYRQAIARGDLERDQLERTWNHTAGAKRKNERSFHRSMHGQTRPYGEPFVSGQGTELRYPGDPDAPADETICCHCVLSTRLIGAGASADAGVPGGGGAADEDVLVSDDEAAAEEATAAEEAADDEAAVDGDAAADATELAPIEEPDLGIGDEPDPFAVLPSSSPHGSWQQAQQQQLQRAEQRLVERQAAHATTRADLEAATTAHEQATAELAAARREVDGFRIGVASQIAGADEEAAASGAIAPFASRPVAGPAPVIADVTDPARAPRDTVIRSDKPAPLGYEAWDYNGEIYYRHAVGGGPFYNAEQLAEHQQGYPVVLAGPNEQFPGFETVGLRGSDVRYRSKESGQAYTRAQIDSGEAAKDEAWLRQYEARAAQTPGLFRRVTRFLGLGA
jgi:hypothetical protein